MLIWLLDQFGPLLERLEFYSTGDSRVFITARTALASLTAFLMAILLGPLAIRWLQSRFREPIKSDSDKLNELQSSKQDTPTMGGLFVVGAIVISVLAWGDLGNRFVQLGLFSAISFGALGAYDDWTKLTSKKNGLKAKQKLLAQILISSIVLPLLYLECRKIEGATSLISPIGNYSIPLGIGFIFWGILVLVGSSNAVNLTDGLDGLASGCLIMCGATFVALTYLAGHSQLAGYLSIPFIPGCGELTIVMGALVGAVMGFLWFNCYPAQVFMGDTGSLSLGSLIGLAAMTARQEALLVIAGGIFVIETLSVIMQVGWYKISKKRLIACSPLHNHYLFKGQHEIKIVTRFWIAAALLAILALASLKIR
ncbi:MAG: phospho-N-acetylmuramoyl-pentapeptide-transferase [Planctomycetaceae bacterium]